MVESAALGIVAQVAAFIVVMIFIFALLAKTKILGENKAVQVITAILIGIVFASFAGARKYVVSILPWFVILIVILVLLLVIMGFVGKMDFMNRGIGIAFLILLIIGFVITAIVVFSNVLGPYFPWNSGVGGDPDVLQVTSWLYSARVFGAIIILAIGALVAFWLVKMK